MKIHTTNYKNTFIEIADDCLAIKGEVPPTKENTKTIANIQFEMVNKNPYAFTSDDVLFQVYTCKNYLIETEHKQAREQFFSKGQPCFRTSSLTKRYGWGVHCDENGKIAIYGVETNEYKLFTSDTNIKKIKAMKSSK